MAVRQTFRFCQRLSLWERLSGQARFPLRCAFAESCAANAVCRYDPTRENGAQKRPQAFLCPEI